MELETKGTLVTRDTRLICAETGDYPLFLDDFRDRTQAVIGVSINSDALETFGYFVVEDVPRPTTGNVISEGTPVKDEETGKWKRNWIVREYTAEEYAALLQQTKDTMDYKVDQFRNEQFAIGFPHLFGEEGKLYHVQVDLAGRSNITALRTLAKEAIEEGTPFEVVFRVYENVNVTMTAQEMVDMANTAVAQVQAGYAVAWKLKDDNKAATTLEDIPVIPEQLFTL